MYLLSFLFSTKTTTTDKDDIFYTFLDMFVARKDYFEIVLIPLVLTQGIWFDILGFMKQSEPWIIYIIHAYVHIYMSILLVLRTILYGVFFRFQCEILLAILKYTDLFKLL